MTVTTCFLLLLLMFVATSNAHVVNTLSQPSGDSACHAVAPADRTDCGFPGITERRCRWAGCCYDDKNEGYNFCFNKPNQDDIDKKLCQVVDPWQRQDCGYDGISQRLCELRGCCYDETIKGVKFCFARSDICDVDTHKRADCGYRGITQDECERKGCCFDARSTYGPQCFYSAPWFGYSQTPGLCEVGGSDRRDCGFAGITEDQCKSQGCCFDSSDPNSIWCFYGRSYCNVGVSDRHDCGHPGISEGECNRRGCCFDSSTEGSIWCFYGLGRCEVAGRNRRDCGYPGIPEDECKSQGCCFDSSDKHSIWCFYGNDQRNEGPQNQNLNEFDFVGEFAQSYNPCNHDSCEDRTGSEGDGSYSNDNNDKSRDSDDNSYDGGHTCPYIPPNQRVDCGYEGISSRDCRSRGCCFNSQQTGVIWCYDRTPANPPGCSVPGHKRVDCGYPGIKDTDCRMSGCCYDDSQPGVPWCFYPKHRSNTGGVLTQKYDSGDEDSYSSGYTCPYIPPNQRVDCGYEGISSRECRSRGCCFNNQQKGVIWCYDRTPAVPRAIYKCSVPGHSRQDCGYPGITESKCLKKKCCYDDSQPGVPWCFYPNKHRSNTGGELTQKYDSGDDDNDGRHTCPYIPPNQRVDCGYEGISSRDCRSRGCCFNNRQKGVIWCYDRTPANPPGCSVSGHRRVECGYPGIKDTQCRMKGCCYDDSQPGVPWCFYPKLRSSIGGELAQKYDSGDEDNSYDGRRTCPYIPPNQRVDCGYEGISSRLCRSRGCCFNNQQAGVIWCYSPIPANPPGCSFSVHLRVDCGYPGIKDILCRMRGCCYDSSQPGVPWCFYPKLRSNTGGELAQKYDSGDEDNNSYDGRHTCPYIPPNQRIDCGYEGISSRLCRSRGCCFNNRQKGVIWCYSPVPANPPGCRVSGHHRVDCGYEGIKVIDCRMKGCCYDDSQPGVPWCFYPKHPSNSRGLGYPQSVWKSEPAKIKRGRSEVS